MSVKIRSRPRSQNVPPPGPQEPGWVALSGYNPSAGASCPKTIRFWDGKQQTLNYWNQVLTGVVEKLYRDGRLTVEDLPIGWSPKVYSVHTEPVHPTGKELETPSTLTEHHCSSM